MADIEDWEPPEDADADSARPSAGRLLGILGLAVVALLAVNLLTGGGPTGGPARPMPTASAASAGPAAYTPPPPLPIGVDSTHRCPQDLGGLALGGDPRPSGVALQRWQCQDEEVARSAIVVRRAAGGWLGHLGAVVTWPLTGREAAATGLTPSPDRSRRQLVWPLAGGLARVRGDLPEDDLIAIARRVTERDTELSLVPPPGLVVVLRGRYAAQLVQELRYSPQAVGVTTTLGYDGPVFTGLQGGAALEDGLYAARARVVGDVGGLPAMLGPFATAVVAWEVEPGRVAYVGYGSQRTSDGVVGALLALARGSRLLTQPQFQALVR